MVPTKSPINKIYLPDYVGKGYGAFWRWTGRYRVVKGSRASKKSRTAALYYIVSIMQHPGANLLVIRKVFRTLKDSCYAVLNWAIHRLQVQDYWDCKASPLEMTYIPTGQKIFFRGLDDPLKLSSITATTGYLCWAWVEEAYEIGSEADFDMINESIRGALPEDSGLFKQITLTFNPWNEHHWLKARFFDKPDPDTLAMTTDYRINEWLDDADRAVFEKMKINNPRRYRVAGLGDWGIIDGLVYEKWEEKAFDIDEIRKLPSVRSAFGLDFGYTNDPSAFFCGLIDPEAQTLWVFDELYKKGASNEDIARDITAAGYQKERIYADCAEPKSIDRLRTLGLRRVEKSIKGRDSIMFGVDYIQDLHIIIHPKCVNFLTEIGNYTWDTDRTTGKKINRPIDDFNHLMDAMRYGLMPYARGSNYDFH